MHLKFEILKQMAKKPAAPGVPKQSPIAWGLASDVNISVENNSIGMKS